MFIKGQPLIWPVMIILCWVGCRVAITEYNIKPPPDIGNNINDVTDHIIAKKVPDNIQGNSHLAHNDRRSNLLGSRIEYNGSENINTASYFAAHPNNQAGYTENLIFENKGITNFSYPNKQQPSYQNDRKVLYGGEHNAAAKKNAAKPNDSDKRLSLYGSFFWRRGSAPIGMAPTSILGNQYGGSQASITATYRISGEATPLSFVLRANKAINTKDRDIAAGLRWRPLRNMPIDISAEKRFGKDSNDIMLYVSGGRDFKLPAKVTLSSYGQAGYVLPLKKDSQSSHFFDGSLLATRKIIGKDKSSISVGGGIWAGGQRGVHRIDAGPFVEGKAKIGAANLRISAGWRWRIDGNANINNGPAINISTSY